MKTEVPSNTKTRRHGELRRRTEDTKIPPARTFVSLQHGLLLSAFVSLCLLNTSLAFLTKSSSWGLTISLEETKDHRRGRKPPVVVRQQKKPRRGDRVLMCCTQTNWTFCRPFGASFPDMFLTGGSSLRSGAGGVHPRLWSFAPPALIYRTAIISLCTSCRSKCTRPASGRGSLSCGPAGRRVSLPLSLPA